MFADEQNFGMGAKLAGQQQRGVEGRTGRRRDRKRGEYVLDRHRRVPPTWFSQPLPTGNTVLHFAECATTTTSADSWHYIESLAAAKHAIICA